MLLAKPSELLVQLAFALATSSFRLLCTSTTVDVVLFNMNTPSSCCLGVQVFADIWMHGGNISSIFEPV